MTDVYDYDNPPWLPAAIERFGQPRVSPPKGGHQMPGLTRYGWVWFPAPTQENHGLHVDVFAEHLCIKVWGPGLSLERGEDEMPTEEQMIASFALVWERAWEGRAKRQGKGT